MSNIYESSKLLSEYLLFHYGKDEEILPASKLWPEGMREALGFPVRTVTAFSAQPVERGLDVGCAVGRSTFEMSRNCGEVVGIDFSAAFVNAAQRLGAGEEIPYERLDEGNRYTPLLAKAPVGLTDFAVRFEQGDAMDLSKSLGTFDRVHAANLICRLPEPERFLKQLPALVKPGGELVLATPCTWLEEFTPRHQWPEGETFSWLKSRLGADFDLIAEKEEPFLIRETARKFQWTTSLVTVWRRK